MEIEVNDSDLSQWLIIQVNPILFAYMGLGQRKQVIWPCEGSGKQNLFKLILLYIIFALFFLYILIINLKESIKTTIINYSLDEKAHAKSLATISSKV